MIEIDTIKIEGCGNSITTYITFKNQVDLKLVRKYISSQLGCVVRTDKDGIFIINGEHTKREIEKVLNDLID